VFQLNPAFAPDEAGMGTAYHPSMSLTNHAAKRSVEEALYFSGMRFTILKPALFMQMLGFELAAPGMVDRNELAALIGTAIGRPVDAGEISADEFAARIPPGPTRDGLGRMNAEHDHVRGERT
jgi:hypothetical protein